MTGLSYIFIFFSKWIIIGLIYCVLFMLFKTVRNEMNTQVEGKSNRRLPAGVPGRLEVIKNNQDSKTQIAIGSIYNLQIETNLGSDRTNEVFLRDQSISGRHACMSWDGADWWIEDLGSTNGTFVNGRPCSPHREEQVPFGATLSLGHLAFKLCRE